MLLRRTAACLGLIVLVGAVLRWSGMTTELWFDEIESIQFVQPMHHAGQVLFALHTDNKHHLIWLWDWLLGGGRADWAYRLPSFAAGVAVLPVLFAVLCRRFGASVGLATAAAAAFLGPLVSYSSEARGYALAVLAAVVAFGLAPDSQRRESAARAAAFGVTLVLGFLSHLTFVYVYAGLLIWALVEAVRRPRWMLLAYHGPVAMALGALWWFDVRHLQYGGGPATHLGAVLGWAVSLCFGVPGTGAAAIGVGSGVLLLACLGWWAVLRRDGPGPAMFFLVSILLAPALLIVTRRNPFLAVRYFLVVFPFVLMLTAVGAMQRRWLRVVGAVFLGAIVVTGVRSSLELYTVGRGHVRSALLTMQQQTPGPVIRFASARPIMDDADVQYYQTSLPRPSRFVDVAADGTAPAPPWWILDLDDPSLVGPPLLHRRRRTYQLDSVFPAVPGSGLTWDLYRLQP